MRKRLLHSLLAAISTLILTHCGDTAGGNGSPYYGAPHPLGPYPSPAARAHQIATEPRGNFYYGRRYFVDKTRFWGYLRRPGQPWASSKLVIMNEDVKRQPDRLPENGPYTARYGYDQNYEYKIFGHYTGRTVYDPNSNLFLPEFRLTGYQLLNKKPGWIFSPRDQYHPHMITLRTY